MLSGNNCQSFSNPFSFDILSQIASCNDEAQLISGIWESQILQQLREETATLPGSQMQASDSCTCYNLLYNS
jgi:hypothetical protein